jgi:hypothetical protein
MLRLATLASRVQGQIDRAAAQLVQLITYLIWLQLKLLLICVTGSLWYAAFKAKNRLQSELNASGGWPRALIGPAEDSTHISVTARGYLSFLDRAARDEWRATLKRWWSSLLYTRTGSTVVLNVMLYGSGVVFLLMPLNSGCKKRKARRQRIDCVAISCIDCSPSL